MAIAYYNEHEDAEETRQAVERYGRKCLLLPGDLKCEETARAVVDRWLTALAAGLHGEQSRRAIFAKEHSGHHRGAARPDLPHQYLLLFLHGQGGAPHLKCGSSIINTASITTYKGSEELLDYSATKGAVVGFTRSLSLNLEKKGIRVNAVAQGRSGRR